MRLTNTDMVKRRMINCNWSSLYIPVDFHVSGLDLARKLEPEQQKIKFCYRMADVSAGGRPDGWFDLVLVEGV